MDPKKIRLQKRKEKRQFSLEKSDNCQIRNCLKRNFKNINQPKRKRSKILLEKVKLKSFNNLKTKAYCAFMGLKNPKEKLKEITITEGDNKNKENQKTSKIQYIEVKELGHGAFGTCYLYTSTSDWESYAAKIVSKEILQKDKNKQSIVDEINTQKSLNYPKVVKVISYSEDEKNVYIILELCENRSLADLMRERKNLTEFEVRNYMFQIVQGVKYLHNKKIIHRDLKTNNILLDKNLELKIGDFGLIGKLNNDKDRKHTSCGTLHYMAPEAIIPPEKGYCYEVDIWSIGVIMYHLLTGKYPFNGEKKELGNIILKGEYTFPETPELSEAAKDLIKQILVVEPKKRPGLNQILYHDFFHVGSFPRFLDISTLKNKPNLTYMRKYIPDVDENGLVNKKIDEKILYKLIVNDIGEIKYEDKDKYTLENNTINGVDNWITFIHVSHKGFVYFEINNGMVGILYKSDEDSIEGEFSGIQLILNEKTDEIHEIKEPSDNALINKYNAQKCPSNLKQKFEEFLEYRNKIRQKLFDYENQVTSESNMTEKNTEKDENASIIKINNVDQNSTTEINSQKGENTEKSTIKENTGNNIEVNENNINFIYIKNFIQEKYAKIVLLSDGTKQIFFKDGVQIFISDPKEVVGYVDKKKKRTFIPLINAMKNCSKDFISRLKYIKKSNYKYIKAKLDKKIDACKDGGANDNDNNNQLLY